MADNFFYGLEGSKLFKIYVDEMAFHGAKVGTNVYNEATARAIYGQFGILGFFLARSAAKKAIASRAALEAKYDALSPGSPPFREGDKANFALNGSEITSALVKPKAAGLKGAFSGGPMVEFSLANGKKRKFSLIEDQNVAFVKNLVTRVVPNTQLGG